MAKITKNLKLKTFDWVEDGNIANKDVVTAIFGYVDSNMTKIDDAIDNVISDQDIEQLFAEVSK